MKNRHPVGEEKGFKKGNHDGHPYIMKWKVPLQIQNIIKNSPRYIWPIGSYFQVNL